MTNQSGFKQIIKIIEETDYSYKTIAAELFFIYGVVRMGMDIWSLLV